MLGSLTTRTLQHVPARPSTAHHSVRHRRPIAIARALSFNMLTVSLSTAGLTTTWPPGEPAGTFQQIARCSWHAEAPNHNRIRTLRVVQPFSAAAPMHCACCLYCCLQFKLLSQDVFDQFKSSAGVMDPAVDVAYNALHAGAPAALAYTTYVYCNVLW
jgi:hypothetical protein